ncbi:MAG: FAD-binding oxidoreductase [Actinobacteria bacterium]|nr:FAD-binding oxidoreductase [Actinomycetota bacterium]
MPVSQPVWEDLDGESHTRLPVLATTIEADLCVVGLGGSGLTAVRAALEQGRSVVGIDAGPVGGAAAGRNAGFLLAGMAPFHHDLAAAVGDERATGLYRLTQLEIARMAVQTPDDVRITGSLRIAASDEELADCRRQFDVMRRHGLAVEEYDGPEGRGLAFAGDGVVQPLARCRNLAQRAQSDGAMLFEGSPAVEISGNCVVTPAGRVECGAVVVAVDGSLEAVLPELSARVRTARAQVVATEPLSEALFSRPVYTRWGFDYYQQLPDGRVILGGFRDRGSDAEWTNEAQTSEDVQAHLAAFLREELGIRADITHRWAGLIAFTPDKLPVLGQVRPGVWACGAYSGTGNVVGAICGRLAAGLALGVPSPEATLLAQSPV